jgi:hypothetical protein
LMSVGSWSQVIQWLDLLWTFLLLPLPDGMACKEPAHPNTLDCDTIFDNGCEGTQTVTTCKRCKWC